MAGKPIHRSCAKCFHNPESSTRRKHHIECRRMEPINSLFESLGDGDHPSNCVRSVCGRGDEVLADALRFARDRGLGGKWENLGCAYKRMSDGSAYCNSEGKRRRVFSNGKVYVMIKKGDISDLRNYAYVSRFKPKELAEDRGLEV